MKTLRTLIVLSAVIIYGCSGNQQTKSIDNKPDFPFEYVDSKSESGGDNKMDLYAYSGTINTDSLKLFCKEQKGKYTNGVFYYLVIFDSKENASFPNNPMTAFYGMDEEPQKHIRAYYTYNRLNGYSKLNNYEKNSWESSAEVIDIQ